MNKNLLYGNLASKYIPGGAHTYSKCDDQWPENAPKVIERGKDCYVWDADGNKFIDWSMGLTSVSLGHVNDEVNQACIEAMSLGHNFQRPSVLEAIAAERFISYLKDRGEMVKFAKNGSTVTTAAIKLARSYTGRAKVAVCAEHPFFSYDDWFIGTTRCPSGIPHQIRDLTVKFSFNDIASVQEMFQNNKNQIAALIIEPMKFDEPVDDFLSKLQKECEKNGTVFVIDEMITGFKWHNQGASKFFDVQADLYTWGKGMANGHSVCALTGRKEIMELGGISHNKPKVFLASSTHGAEIPQLAALMKTLDIFESQGPIDSAWKIGKNLKRDLNEKIRANDLAGHLSIIGADCLFAPVITNAGMHKNNVARTYLLQELVQRGQLFQGLFYPTRSHDEQAIKATLNAWGEVLPLFKEFIFCADRSLLKGSPTKPVFRAFNSCECLTPKDCQKCDAGNEATT
jgi:glutamate-1-semialdehyde 2,1-aminomutase